jgi:hypothetical protein
MAIAVTPRLLEDCSIWAANLGKGLSLTASGDIGGSRASIGQLVGTLESARNSWVTFQGGFRTLNINYGGSRADFNVNLYGPVLSLTLRL